MSNIRADAFYPAGSALCKSALAIQYERLQIKARQANNVTSTPRCHGFAEAQNNLSSLSNGTSVPAPSLFDNIDEDLPLEQQFAQLLGISMHGVHIADSYRVLLRTDASNQALSEVADDQREAHYDAFLRHIGAVSGGEEVAVNNGNNNHKDDNTELFTEPSIERPNNIRSLLPETYSCREQCLEYSGLHTLKPLFESF